MKDWYGKATSARISRGKHGDYMLQSRTRSGSAEHAPITIKYDSNYEEHPIKYNPVEVSIDQIAAESYTEEFLLIQSGDFLLTAPSCHGPVAKNNVVTGQSHYQQIPAMIDFEEYREAPPPEILHDLGRSHTESFDIDFPSIEKTYTTFVNVAEDQIYPLEWKDFLEVARDEDVLPPIKSKVLNASSPRKFSKESKGAIAAANRSMIAATTNRTGQHPPSGNEVSAIENNDSGSLNSDAKKFRLFPNIRDVATRRTKRMEAARNRRRLLDGKKIEKKEKKDRFKRDKDKATAPATSATTDATATPTQQQPNVVIASTKRPAPMQPTKSDIPAATSMKVEESSTNPDIGLHELAEKILGKEIRKSEDLDFTKKKRNGKKKKNAAAALNNSTSFPTEFPSDTLWDVTKVAREFLQSQDDDIVAYDQTQTINDVSDTVTVARGVEAIFASSENDMQGLMITVEKSDKVPVMDIVPKPSNDKYAPNYALSKSFDDQYHSSFVKSIKKEIELPQSSSQDVAGIPAIDYSEKPSSLKQSDYSLASMSEPAFQHDLKWFNFGKQPTQQLDSLRQNEEHQLASDEQPTVDDRDDVPNTVATRSLTDDMGPEAEVQPLGQHKLVSNTWLPKASIKSYPTEKYDDDKSVLSSTGTPVYRAFLGRASTWLTKLVTKMNIIAGCSEDSFLESTALSTIGEIDDIQETNDVVATPSLDDIPEMSRSDVSDEINVDVKSLPLKEMTSATMESTNSSISINSNSSSKTYDTDDSDSVGSDDDENISRATTDEWVDNVEVGWCG
jgi:hypothetical protein